MPNAFLLSPILDQKENQDKIRAMIERSDEEHEGDEVFIQQFKENLEDQIHDSGMP